MSGWFAIKRGTLEHEVFAPEGKWSRFEAWTWMIENAAYKPHTIDLAGTPHTVPRGALCFSLRFLADKWSWSVKAVRSFLAKLERHGAVQIQTVQVGNKVGTARTQVTLCNYEKYQSQGHSEGTAGAQQGHKEKQGNKETKDTLRAERAKSERFQEFWDTFPHRGGAKRDRKASQAKYERAIKSGVTEQELIDAARRYGHDEQVQRGFAKDPKTWLNGECWKDEIELAKPRVVNAHPQIDDTMVVRGVTKRYAGNGVGWVTVHA